MIYCPKCGAALEEGSNFCKACGHNVSGIEPKLPATRGQRLANLFLDGIFRAMFAFILGFIYGGMGGKNVIVSFCIGFLSFFLYYALFEGLWQRSPAKWITGTKVVMRDGSKPSVGRILLRVLCMLIPFDVFSYLGNHTPEGWHDRLSHVLVVPSHYTEADVQAIDRKALRKSGSIVWIVIGIVFGGLVIIGILATIVLASLGAARDKANDTKAQSLLMQVPDAANDYTKTSKSGGYDGFCDSDFVKNLIPAENTSLKLQCGNTADTLGLSIMTKQGSYECTDSTGVAVRTKTPVSPDGVCPPEAPMSGSTN